MATPEAQVIQAVLGLLGSLAQLATLELSDRPEQGESRDYWVQLEQRGLREFQAQREILEFQELTVQTEVQA